MPPLESLASETARTLPDEDEPVIHFNNWRKGTAAPAPSDLVQPLTPAAYLRLRRKASGMSIKQVAARCAPQAMHNDAEILISMLEDEGVKAKSRETIEQLAIGLCIDTNVYFQLAEEPADRHPQICRGCGCSEWDPCYTGRGTCSRSGHLCSAAKCGGEAVDASADAA